MGRFRRFGALSVVAAMSLGLVACGGGSDSASTTTTTTAPTDDTSDGGSADLAAFKGECAAFVQAYAGVSIAVSTALGGAPQEDLQAAADYFEEVAPKIPREIRADFDIFLEAYTKFAKAIADSGIDFTDPSTIDPSKLSELQELSKAFSDPKVQEASSNVQEYITTTCKS